MIIVLNWEMKRPWVPINVLYKGQDLGLGYRMDMLIEDILVLELKSVEILTDAYKKQLHTYLKLANKPLGLLINFNTTNLSKNIIHIANGDISSLL